MNDLSIITPLNVLKPHNDDSHHDNLTRLINLYFKIHVAGSSINTIDAKQRDLKLFIDFFINLTGNQSINLWTPSVTRSFQNYLLCATNSGGLSYKATSVSRIMSTLKHFARWLHKQKPLPAGNSFEGIKIVEVDEPTWNGLSDKQIARLRSACDQRIAICKKANQNPLLEVTIFYILLNTGLRESELVNLNYGQYHSRGFHNVVRSKSKKITRKVPLPQEAKDYLDKYLQIREELTPTSPLLVTKNGGRISRFEIIRACKRISMLANAYLPPEEKFHLTPHQLRHTFLKHIADKHDIHVAQKMSGNVSIREIFRYTQPSDDEIHNYVEILFK